MPTLLAALLACLMLATAAAQNTPPPDVDERTALLFRLGMTALRVAERTHDEAERIQMYDEAIEAFRTILVQHPDLVRVRLELARTFFLKGRDQLARRHFELVLESGPPPQVAANIQRYLALIEARSPIPRNETER